MRVLERTDVTLSRIDEQLAREYTTKESICGQWTLMGPSVRVLMGSSDEC